MKNYKKKKASLPVYLDEFERERLEKIASDWGTSLSTTIKRLIREREINC
ncbi:MAG: ribbon-helix-helix protein, CopG family [Nostoc sp.]